jgi:hypothetical protein
MAALLPPEATHHLSLNWLQQHYGTVGLPALKLHPRMVHPAEHKFIVQAVEFA